MISMKAKYAVQALIHMALRSTETSFVARKIAQAEEIPQKFLEEILLDMRKAGILRSKAGKCGGYSFRTQPENITLQDTFKAISDPLASQGFNASSNPTDFTRVRDIDYLLEPIERRLHAARRSVLAEITITQLAEQLQTREEDELVPDFQI